MQSASSSVLWLMHKPDGAQVHRRLDRLKVGVPYNSPLDLHTAVVCQHARYRRKLVHEGPEQAKHQRLQTAQPQTCEQSCRNQRGSTAPKESKYSAMTICPLAKKTSFFKTKQTLLRWGKDYADSSPVFTFKNEVLLLRWKQKSFVFLGKHQRVKSTKLISSC